MSPNYTMSNDRFEDRLLAAILDDYDTLTGEAGRRSPLSAYRPSRRSGSLRRTRRLAAALGAAAAITLGVIVGVNTLAKGPPPRVKATTGTAHGTAPGVALDAKTVTLRTGHALSSAQNYILRASEKQTNAATGGTYRSVSWSNEGNSCDFRTAEYGPSGPLEVDGLYYVSRGNVVGYTIDYIHRQYNAGKRRVVIPAKRAGGIPGPRQCSASRNDATGIAGDLANGTDQLLGLTTINGHPVLHLSNNEPGMRRQIWIDPTTYLPVQMTAHGSWGSYRISYTWTARTPQRVKADFRPAIPPGFAR